MNPENRPPPPPLPPSLPPPGKCHEKKSIVTTEDEKIQEFSKVVERFHPCNYLREPFYSYYSYLEPQLQDGPKCGLVALSIASKKSINELFDIALDKGFTKQGEMFSVDWLAKLAEEYFKTRIIEDGLSSHISCILNCLLNNGFMLVPYDADFNHSPCQKLGRKAHWAVVSGFVIFVPKSSHTVFLQSDRDICKCLDGFKVKDIEIVAHDQKIIVKKMNEIQDDHVNEGKLYVIARQGKSRHLALWGLDELDSSNFNLIEFSPDRDFDDYILPPGGVSQGLKGKAVLLFPKAKKRSIRYENE